MTINDKTNADRPVLSSDRAPHDYKHHNSQLLHIYKIWSHIPQGAQHHNRLTDHQLQRDLNFKKIKCWNKFRQTNAKL